MSDLGATAPASRSLSVIEAAARAGIDIRAYVRDILVKLSSGWKMSQLDELLPENWIPTTAQPR